ncbi:heavy-metal-associated domain-containing protein [Nitratifractor sp.]
MRTFWMFVCSIGVLFAGEKIAVIDVSGMTCPLCTVAVKRSLKKTPGVIKAKVKLNTHKATVRFRDDLNTTRLLEAIKKAGYEGKILSVTPADKP